MVFIPARNGQRLALWSEVIERGKADDVCNEIVRNRKVPRSLLAALAKPVSKSNQTQLVRMRKQERITRTG